MKTKNKSMQNGWTQAEYQIQMHRDQQIYGEKVSGIQKNGFGIHETDSGWNITHIASGWNCFTAESESGAEILAHYLMTTYYADFSRLKVSGTELQNYKTLLERIGSDTELKELIRLFTNEERTRQKAGQREIELTILS